MAAVATSLLFTQQRIAGVGHGAASGRRGGLFFGFFFGWYHAVRYWHSDTPGSRTALSAR
jgi:hypothetical protein